MTQKMHVCEEISFGALKKETSVFDHEIEIVNTSKV